MLGVSTCVFLSFTCFFGPADTTATPPQEQKMTVFERINAERAARQGVQVTQHVKHYPHAPSADRHPMTLRDMLENYETWACARAVRRLPNGKLQVYNAWKPSTLVTDGRLGRPKSVAID